MEYSQFNQKIQVLIKKVIYSLPSELSPAIGYLVEGKKIRSHMMYDCSSILGLDPYKILSPSVFLEVIHSISLMHDDVIDSTTHRRNMQNLNALFNPQTNIYSGNFLLFELLSFFFDFDKTIRDKMIFKILELFSGEFYQDNQLSITKEKKIKTYLDIVRKKTGALFSIAFSSPAILQKRSVKEIDFYNECGYTFGITYQLMDDFNDLDEDLNQTNIAQIQSTLPLLIWKKYDEKNFENYLKLIKNQKKKSHKMTKDIKQKIKEKTQKFIKDECNRLKKNGEFLFSQKKETRSIFDYTMEKIDQVTHSSL